MTNVLTIPTDSPEFEQAPAEAGVFLEEFMRSRSDTIEQALCAFEHIEAARGVIRAANVCPQSISELTLEEAKGTIEDQGSIWRRETDRISHGIGSQYPRQAIPVKYFGSGYFTDERRLYHQGNGDNPWIFSSFLSQNELDNGMRIATEEMWRDVLARLLAIAPAKNERAREARAVVQLTLTEGIL